jgi:hypothetical protein
LFQLPSSLLFLYCSALPLPLFLAPNFFIAALPLDPIIDVRVDSTVERLPYIDAFAKYRLDLLIGVIDHRVEILLFCIVIFFVCGRTKCSVHNTSVGRGHEGGKISAISGARVVEE